MNWSVVDDRELVVLPSDSPIQKLVEAQLRSLGITTRRSAELRNMQAMGQKAPFKLKDVYALRVRLQMERRVRELALFNLGIDSKLPGCDLVSLNVRDVRTGPNGDPHEWHATQDPTASAVRDLREHARRASSLDQASRLEAR